HQAAELVARHYATVANGDVGLIHGDLAPSNIRLDPKKGLTLFDFGALQRAWRGNELLNVWHRALPKDPTELRDQRWREFLAGYQSVRPVPARLEEFKVVWRLTNKLATMGYICNALTLRLG